MYTSTELHFDTFRYPSVKVNAVRRHKAFELSKIVELRRRVGLSAKATLWWKSPMRSVARRSVKN